MVLAVGHKDLVVGDTRVAQVLRLCSTLVAEARQSRRDQLLPEGRQISGCEPEEHNGFALQDVEVGIRVVVTEGGE